MALVGVELETLVFEPDALTTRPPSERIGFRLNTSLALLFAQTKSCRFLKKISR